MTVYVHDLIGTAIERHDIRAEADDALARANAELWTAPAQDIDRAMLALALATEDPMGYDLAQSDDGGHVVFPYAGAFMVQALTR